MYKQRYSRGKQRILVGALAGMMVMSSLALGGCSSEASEIDTVNEKVILYDDSSELSEMASKATSVSTYKDYKNGEYQSVKLEENSISFNGEGATINGSDLIITKAGTYVISGKLNDGAIIIDSADEENVNLVLENADITCKDGAPIYVKNCGKNVILSVPETTVNTITDASEYTYEYKEEETDSETGEISLEPSAAIFSKDDLKINGKGKLTINAQYKDGITGKDDIEIAEATLIINAVDDGIVGKDSVVIGSGDFTIKAQGDGIKSTNSDNTEKGYIAISDGTFDITSGNDGIQAESVIMTLGGKYTIKTGEGSAVAKTLQENMQNPEQRFKSGEERQMPGNTESMLNKDISFNETETEDETESIKALKAGKKIVIQDGEFNIDSEDDGVHSNDSVAIATGTLNISTGDDGIHADNSLDIYDGTIDVKQSYEGLEGVEINIHGGNINIVSSDDGINIAGGNDNSGFFSESVENESTQKLTISGGNININSDGDGIDLNGSGYMTGGIVAVSGPTNNGNGGLDYDGVFEVTGGTLIVAGSSGMAQAPSSETTINTIATAVDTQEAGTEIKLLNSAGKTILSFKAEKSFSHLVISSSVIEKGETYRIMAGSTEIANFTADEVVTNLSGNTNMRGGMTPPNDMGNMKNRKPDENMSGEIPPFSNEDNGKSE